MSGNFWIWKCEHILIWALKSSQTKGIFFICTHAYCFHRLITHTRLHALLPGCRRAVCSCTRSCQPQCSSEPLPGDWTRQSFPLPPLEKRKWEQQQKMRKELCEEQNRRALTEKSQQKAVNDRKGYKEKCVLLTVLEKSWAVATC